MAKVNILGESVGKADASQVVKVFENPEFGKVRVIIIDNIPMFIASDVASALGYKDPNKAIQMHCKSGNPTYYRKAYIPHSNGVGGVNVILIGESNIYRLVMRSDLESAEKFQDWVFEEVLPSIQKTGSYSLMEEEILKPSNYVEQIEGLATWVKMVSDMLNLNNASKVSYLKKVGDPLALPVPDYVPSKGVVKSATELLKENGIPLSAIAFNKIAMNKGALVELSRKSSHGYKKFKNIAADWLEFGENQVNPNNPKETQPLWYVDKFPELLKKLEIL